MARPEAEEPLDEPALRANCQMRLQLSFLPVRFFVVNDITRNEMGKIQRGCLLDIAKSKLN
jgi:hypothetical protein